MNAATDSHIGPVVLFGTYDLGKPRNRLMLASLETQGIDVKQIHVDLWRNIEDKTQTTWRTRLIVAVRWLAAYPVLVWKYLWAPKHAVVLIAYPGILDIIVVALFARARGAKIVLDAFISVYDTIVIDRKLIKSNGILAKLLFQAEKLACHLARLVILDTKEHANYFQALFGLPAHRISSVMVGCEAERFPRLEPRSKGTEDSLRVLFYGQFIPLHGIETIVAAARLARDQGESIDWTIIGTGQEAPRIQANLAADPLPRLTWNKWVEYVDLIDFLQSADVCLGIFGASGKASRVIPNKVFQILSAGCPLVTMDSAAIQELLSGGDPGIRLVPPNDPRSLLNAILELGVSAERPPPSIADRFSKERLGARYCKIISDFTG